PPGEASSQQAQKQFHIPGGPANVPFPPMGHFHLIPSQAHVTHLNYGEGFGNDPNIQSLQLELNKKLLQQQIEILQNHLQNLQFTEAERSVDDGTSSSESRGKLSTSADIQD
ncbi:E3 ubiquitin-protein ligase synoviolin, partial [Trifolium pratense]